MNNSYFGYAIALLLGGTGGYFMAQKMSGAAAGKCISEKRCTLRTGMRQLWADHVVWIRNYIIATVAETTDVHDATKRLLQNQDDIGNAIIPYYGKEAGQKLTALLKDHITIAVDLIAAAKLKDADKVTELDTKWHANAQEIATFLSTANPNWPQEMLLTMLNAHLTLTTEELMARLASDWPADVVAFDKVFSEAMAMADDLTNGIVAQFPQKF